MNIENISSFKIRNYEKSDYDRVCKLFSEGNVAGWFNFYKASLNFWKAPKTTLIQVLQFFMSYLFLNSLTSVLIVQFFIQCIIMMICFYLGWNWVKTQLNTNMKDEKLSEWTTQGAGFYVAAIDNFVVGTIAYKIEVYDQNKLL